MSKSSIMISGTSASGKSLICRLLDGHPDLKVIHRHDKILSSLAFPYENWNIFLKKYITKDKISNIGLKYFPKKDKKSVLLKYKSKKIKFYLTPFLFRKMLIDFTGYYLNETQSWLKRTDSSVSSTNYKYDVFNFDFKKHDHFIFSKIFGNKKKILTPENILNIFMESFVNNLYKKKNNKKIVYMGENNLNTIEMILKENFETKIIYMLRHEKGILLSRSIRQVMQENTKEKNLLKKINKKMENNLYANYLKMIKKNKIRILDLQKNYPKKIKIINLEDIFKNKVKTVNSICEWLSIKQSSKTHFVSFYNKKIKNQKEYLNKMNDDKYKLSLSIENFFNIKSKGFMNFIKSDEEKSFFAFILILKNFYYSLKNKIGKI